MRNEICEKCNGTGWVTIKKDEAEFAQKCDCRYIEQFLLKCENANIPQRFLDATLEGYYPDKNFPIQKKAKKVVKKFINDYPSVLKGLLLQGTVGVGKTRLLCTIATELLKKNIKTDILYIDWNDFSTKLRSSYGQFDLINRFISDLSTVELLIFDEMGGSTAIQWVWDNIYYIFNKRYNDQKVTLCATNYFDEVVNNQETLNQRIGERIRSRLYEMTENVIIGGKDFRKEYE